MPAPADDFLDDLAWLSSTRQGRRILHRLIVMTGCLNALPTHEVLWHAGRESVGQEFLAQLARDFPDRLALLLTENMQGRDDHDSADRDTDDGA
jgi:hypothetical protein